MRQLKHGTANRYSVRLMWRVTNHVACFGAQAARPEVQERLRALPGVTVIPRDEKLKYRHTHSRIWNETWLAAFFHKPCNHELFVLQSLNMEGASVSLLETLPVSLQTNVTESGQAFPVRLRPCSKHCGGARCMIILSFRNCFPTLS